MNPLPVTRRIRASTLRHAGQGTHAALVKRGSWLGGAQYTVQGIHAKLLFVERASWSNDFNGDGG